MKSISCLVLLLVTSTTMSAQVRPPFTSAGEWPSDLAADLGPGEFLTANSYPIGSGPGSVAIGDFNRDGYPDIAVAQGGTNSVGIMLNNRGLFSSVVSYPTGPDAIGVAVGDLNHDGYLDLAVANINYNGANGSLSVLLGVGDGSFGSAINYAVGNQPISVAMGDFNHDGNMDVAVANFSDDNAGTLSVLLGNGNGTLQPPASYDTGVGPTMVAVGDLNGDGNLDLIASILNNERSFEVDVLEGNPDGTFQTAHAWSAGQAPESMVLGDFNGDGRLDLAVSNLPGTVSILLGNGDMTFQFPVNYSAGYAMSAGAVTAGDFRGTGVLDLLVSNRTNTVAWLKGNGDGTFQTPVVYAAQSFTYAIAAADFNDDDFLDFAVVNISTNSVSTVFGNGDGSFQAARNYGWNDSRSGSPYAVAVGDFNSDGYLDLAVGDVDAVDVLLGQRDGTFGPATFYPAVTAAHSIAIADFNGDSIPDLAVTLNYSNVVRIFLGNGDGSFDVKGDFPSDIGPVSVVTGDFNHDRIIDLAIANSGSNDVSVLLGFGGGAFKTAVNYPAGLNPISLVASDFNRDGNQDLAVANIGDDQVSILLGLRGGNFQVSGNYQVGCYPASITQADFNEDGKPDLATANECGSVSVLLGNGDSTFQPSKTLNASRNACSVSAADFNRDGDLDLVVASGEHENNVDVLQGYGDGTFGPAINFTAGDSPAAVAVADFNRDRSPDLVTANYFGDDVTVLLNTAGTFVSTLSPQRVLHLGDTVTFKTTVIASLEGWPTPIGSVIYKDGDVAIGTAPLNNGQAKFSTANLALGTHRIRSIYSGDSHFNRNHGRPITLNVIP